MTDEQKQQAVVTDIENLQKFFDSMPSLPSCQSDDMYMIYSQVRAAINAMYVARPSFITNVKTAYIGPYMGVVNGATPGNRGLED
jgi:hypothetical protein